MTMKVFLKKASKVIWETTIMVENKRFGRSYKLDNYMEVFSDLGIETVSALLENENNIIAKKTNTCFINFILKIV